MHRKEKYTLHGNQFSIFSHHYTQVTHDITQLYFIYCHVTLPSVFDLYHESSEFDYNMPGRKLQLLFLYTIEYCGKCQIQEIPIEDCPSVLKFLEYFYSSSPFLYIYSTKFLFYFNQNTFHNKLWVSPISYLLRCSSLECMKGYCAICIFRMRYINYIFTVKTLL